ncbi:hypothetical protein [Chryseobacterium oranimense]|uniref:hypothetical protein n=1 Tax=Chryseobacterium oranimense TaxID=421058 RepID=UPI0031DE534E
MNNTDIKPKPFFFRKRFLISLGVLFFLLIKCFQKNTSADLSEKNLAKTEKTAEDKVDLKTRLQNNIKGISDNQNLAKDVKSLDGIIITLALYKVYSSIINEGKASKNNDEQILAKELEKKYPVLRLKHFLNSEISIMD